MRSSKSAISGTFSEYQMVKSRGVLVLKVEVPLESQSAVFAALGYPLPGEEIWVAVARLGGKPAEQSGQDLDTPSRSESGKVRFRALPGGEKTVVRAALLAKDLDFQMWVAADTEDDAATYIREQCGVASRKEFASDSAACEKFDDMMFEFQQREAMR